MFLWRNFKMKNYYGIDFQTKKQEILACEAYKPLLEKIVARADSAIGFHYNVGKISKYMEYYTSGHRRDEEYFDRRNNAMALAIAYYLYEDEKYLNELVDVLHIICGEFTWCIPAHNHFEENPSMDLIIHRIDLFQAETARALTEIAVLLSDKLPYFMLERIEYELRRRIFTAYKTYSYFHAAEGQLNNWSAVCGGGNAAALLHFGTEDEIKELLPRLIKGLDRYLEGLPNDGCCQEGVSYWNFGFASYSYFANILYTYSNGKINYVHNNKVDKLALFPQKVRLNKDMTVSFADAGAGFIFSPGFACYLKRTYNGVLLPELDHATVFFNSITSIPAFFWLDAEYKPDADSLKTTYLDDAQWYVNRKEKFSFATKGGHNYEPHNHNDLGNFLIVVGTDMPLCDLGAPEYIKYKHYDDRMVNLNFSSKGHSVPIINGQYQCLGKEYKSKVIKAEENLFSIDLQGAYEEGIVNKINRTYKISEDGVLLKDIFEYSEKTETITERFVTRTKPQVSDGEINLGTASILFNKELYSVTISEDSYTSHRNMAGEPYTKVMVYLIDFTAKKEHETEFQFDIRIN